MGATAAGDGLTGEGVPGGQPDGLLQEGELRVVEAEGLVHDVWLRLHVHVQERDGLPPAHLEGDLAGERDGAWQERHSFPRQPPAGPLTWMCFVRPAPLFPRERAAVLAPAPSPAGPCGCESGLWHRHGGAGLCAGKHGRGKPFNEEQLPTGAAPTCTAMTAGSAEKVWYLKGMRTVSLGRRYT